MAMATLQPHLRFLPPNNPKLIHLKSPHSFSFSKKLLLSNKLFPADKLNPRFSNHCKATSFSSGAEIEKPVSPEGVNERPSFDINLAVILAGFAFEAYTTPPVISSSYLVSPFSCNSNFFSS